MKLPIVTLEGIIGTGKKNYSLEALGSHYRQYLNFAQIEVDCCVAPTLEEGEVDGNNDLEQLMSFVNSIIEKYEL